MSERRNGLVTAGKKVIKTKREKTANSEHGRIGGLTMRLWGS